jgi:hypothetical protein
VLGCLLVSRGCIYFLLHRLSRIHEMYSLKRKQRSDDNLRWCHKKNKTCDEEWKWVFRAKVACLMLNYVVSILSIKELTVSWYVMFLLISQNIETNKVWILWWVVSINSYPQKTLTFFEKYCTYYGFEVLNVKISCKMWIRTYIIIKLAS